MTYRSFTLDSNQILYKCIKHAIEQEVGEFDLNTILSAAKSLDYYSYFDKKNERDYLRALFTCAIEKDNVRKLAAKVKKLEIAREAISVTEDIQRSLFNVTGDETASQIFSQLENPIFDYVLAQSQGVSEGPKKLGATVHTFIDFVKNNPRQSIGIPTGYKLYDFAIGGGLRPGVAVIAARLKVGKSSLSMNVGFHIAGKLGIPVLIVDSEMKTTDYHPRALANLSNYSIRDIETGVFPDSKKVEQAGKYYEEIPLYHESVLGTPFEVTLATIRRWFLKTVGTDKEGNVKPCVVIYDFLRTTDRGDINSNMQEYQLLGFQIMELNNLVKKYDVPCMCFVQANRQGIDKEHTGIVSGSDRIGWFCTSLALLKRKSSEEIANDGIRNGNRKLVVLEARHGPALQEGEYISMYHEGSKCRITEIGLNHVSDNTSNKDDFEDESEPAF